MTTRTIITCKNEEEDQSPHVYSLGSLFQEGELEPWTLFCADCFSYKKVNPPPPSYFARHYFNDPRRDLSLIRVLFYKNEIVSTLRIFRRSVLLLRPDDNNRHQEEVLQVGGIGEVCSAPSHRNRGLAKILLQDAISIMTNNNMQYSVLHASSALQPFYEKCEGYKSIVTLWSCITLLKKYLPSSSNNTVRKAKFPEDTLQLFKLHRTYSEERFTGCLVRSIDYWNEYLSKEIGDHLFVLEHDDEIVAWQAIRCNDQGRYQLCEFGFNPKNGTISITAAMGLLLEGSALLKQEFNNKKEETFRLLLPTIVLEEIIADDGTKEQGEFIDWSSEIVQENDNGWMYKSLPNSGEAKLLMDLGKPHLIWPSDSF